MSLSTPSGLIPLVEPQPTHQEFIRAVEPEYALIKLQHVRQLVKRGETADSFFTPETDFITTSTINDTQLELISWQNELEFVTEFGSAWHIPTDYSIYEGHDPAERKLRCRKCMTGAVWMKQQFDDLGVDTGVIPLIKGITQAERAICHAAIDEHDFDTAAYYCTQYFSSGHGNNITALVEDLNAVDTELPSQTSLLVLGLLAPSYLERVPNSVVGATGLNQWRSQITPTTQSPSEMRRIYRELESDVRVALGLDTEDPDLTSF